jgi:hypothetical protein
MSSSKPITPEQAADMLGISVEHIHAAVANRVLTQMDQQGLLAVFSDEVRALAVELRSRRALRRRGK